MTSTLLTSDIQNWAKRSEILDKESHALAVLFLSVIGDIKGCLRLWEDTLSKGAKLHNALKITQQALAGFLDSLQKVADVATNGRGATREVGSDLTRLCLRHRNIQFKLNTLNTNLQDSFVNPVSMKLDEWTKEANLLEKEHVKEVKLVKAELKKASQNSVKISKKARKESADGPTLSRLERSVQTLQDKYAVMNETQRDGVRQAMLLERKHYCLFVNKLSGVMDAELSLLSETSPMQDIALSLRQHCLKPEVLPVTSEHVIVALHTKAIAGQDVDTDWALQGPSRSPGSRKSSVYADGDDTSVYCRSEFLRPIYPDTVSLSNTPSTLTGLSTHQKSSIPSKNESSGKSGLFVAEKKPVDDPEDAKDSAKFARPHTISAAYEKNVVRPQITLDTFDSQFASRRQSTSHDKLVSMKIDDVGLPVANLGAAGSANSVRSDTMTIRPRPSSISQYSHGLSADGAIKVAPPRMPGIQVNSSNVQFSKESASQECAEELEDVLRSLAESTAAFEACLDDSSNVKSDTSDLGFPTPPSLSPDMCDSSSRSGRHRDIPSPNLSPLCNSGGAAGSFQEDNLYAVPYTSDNVQMRSKLGVPMPPTRHSSILTNYSANHKPVSPPPVSEPPPPPTQQTSNRNPAALITHSHKPVNGVASGAIPKLKPWQGGRSSSESFAHKGGPPVASKPPRTSITRHPNTDVTLGKGHGRASSSSDTHPPPQDLLDEIKRGFVLKKDCNVDS